MSLWAPQMTCSAHIVFVVIHTVFEHNVQIVSAGFVFVTFPPLRVCFALPPVTELAEKIAGLLQEDEPETVLVRLSFK